MTQLIGAVEMSATDQAWLDQSKQRQRISAHLATVCVGLIVGMTVSPMLGVSLILLRTGAVYIFNRLVTATEMEPRWTN